MGALSPMHWLILAIVVLIFVAFNGSRKIPEIARGLGRGARIFKSEFHELKNDDAKRAQAKAQQLQESTEENSAQHPTIE